MRDTITPECEPATPVVAAGDAEWSQSQHRPGMSGIVSPGDCDGGALSPRQASRRQLLGWTTAGALAAMAGCRSTAEVDPAPEAHVALTSPRARAHVVLARTTEPGVPVEDLARLAREHRASIGLSGGLLPGLAALLPAMAPFEGDVLDPARTNTGMVLLVEADRADEAEERASSLLDRAAGLVTPTWRASVGHTLKGTSRGRALTSNVFGFTEGFGNLADGAATTLIRPRAGVPRWAVGGSLLAMRVIRVSHDLWNRDEPQRHARIIGRHPDGSWLNGDPATEPAPFGTDPGGATTPLDSHVRRANPRDGTSRELPLTRRGWNYRTDAEEGTLFLAYTNDLDRFEAVQRRVIGDALSPYTLTVGGGYYFVPPPHEAWLRR